MRLAGATGHCGGEVGEQILDAIAAYAPDVHDCVEYPRSSAT
jgi:hypothetical protein